MDVFSKVSYLSACSQRCGRSTKRKDSSREKGRGLEDEPEKDDSDAPSPCSCWSRLFIVHIIWEQLQTSSSCPTFLPGILLLLGLRFSSSFCSSGYVRRMHRWTRFGVVGGHPTTPLCSFGHFFPSYSYILRRGKFNYRMRIFLLVFISLRFFFFLCSPRFRFEYFFLFQPKASQDELSAYQHLFAVDLCSEHPIPPTTPIFSAPLGLLAQSNNRHRHRHPLHVPIHIHVQIQIQIQSAVEYLPSMLIEFFPVD